MYKQYKDINGQIITNAIIRVADSATIPFDPANSDFTQFKKDLANGAELQDADGNVIDGIAYLEELS
jgi:hypothetical protein